MNAVTPQHTIAQLYKVAQQVKRPKAFSSQVRDLIDPNFSVKGVKKAYDVTFYTYLESEQLQAKYEAATEDNREALLAWLNNEVENYEEEAEVKEPKAPKAPAPVAPKGLMENKAQTPSAVKKAQQGIEAMFTLNIGAAIQQAVQEEIPLLTASLQEQIQEAAKLLQPNVIKVSGKATEVEITGRTHAKFKESLQKLAISKTLFLSGPTGSGKTFLAEQLAEALKLEFSHLSCTAGMSEAHITGRMLADGSYVSTEFVDAYEKGGLFLFDEVDAADPNTLLIINSALSNGYMSVPNRKDNPRAKRHPEFHIVVAANTWGKGSFDYSGREVLDEAFLDRFRLSMTEVVYDEEMELELTKNHKLTKKLQALRKADRLTKVISTRTIITAYKFSEVMSSQDVFDNLTLDWTEEERKIADGIWN